MAPQAIRCAVNDLSLVKVPRSRDRRLREIVEKLPRLVQEAIPETS